MDHAKNIEKRHEKELPEIALGSAIGSKSSVNFFCWKLDSGRKIDVFYGLGAIIIISFIAFAIKASPIPAPENYQAIPSTLGISQLHQIGR